MPTNQEKQEIRKLAKNGKSVNHITKKLGLPKSTVYYHFRKQVGQKQKENSLSIPTNPETIGEICGTFAGDGNFHKRKEGHYRIRIFLNLNDDYWKILADFLEEELEKRPNIYKNKPKSLVTLDYSSKNLYKMLKKNLEWKEEKGATIRLIGDNKFSSKFKKGFIRGLVDTDGYKNQYGSYEIGTISKPLMTTTQLFLSDLDIESTLKRRIDKRENYRDMYRINITGKNRDKFGKKIRPRHPKKRYTGTK